MFSIYNFDRIYRMVTFTADTISNIIMEEIMRFSIQYQETTDEWAIFDTGGSSSLVLMCRTEEEALIEVLKLQEKARLNSYQPYDDTQQIA